MEPSRRADVEVADWLRGLGLERYEQTFCDNEIDPEILLDLNEADLETLGMPLGSRKRLLKALAALRQQASPGNGSAATPLEHGQKLGHRVRPGAERRQLTVMFCDLVGSTALSARLDPEDLRNVIGTYHTCVSETIARFDGFIAKYMGDGVLAYFGYPQAHEEDAERAVRAGLALVEAVGRLEVSDRLRVRIGIATGLAVVGDLIGIGAAQEEAVIGETPNLAARLQSAAEPDTVVIGHDTRRLIGNLFDCRDLGPVPIKGFAESIQAWQVLDATTVESRFEAIHAASGLTPLVGRAEEVELLLRRWAQAKNGEGRIVLLSGEPGIGKSRIIAALQERIGRESHLRLRYFCSPYHTDSALYPVIRQLGHAAGLKRDDTMEAKLSKLEDLLARTPVSAEETVLLADLLSLSTESRCPPLDLTPKQKRERTLAALVAQIEVLTGNSPVLILFEDAHWIDPTSLDLLNMTVKRVQHLPVLIVITFRPEFRPPWLGDPHVTALTLSRLDSREGAALAQFVANNKTLPSEILDRIVTHTDGVPLFVEELTKAVLESTLLREEDGRYVLDGPLAPLAIPTSLHASLMARLDRLAGAREVAQIGAAIGREFGYELLAAVTSLPDEELRPALEQLVTAELVFAHGTPPDATYMFKHALIQDAAYATLLRSRRQQLHARIANVLEEQFADTAETQPELVAHHCAQADLTAKAVDYGHRAGQLAIRRSAMAEAVAHFAKALGLLASLPESAERHREEFRLQLARAQALVQSRGWASPEMAEACSRACELSREVEEIPKLELFSALHGLWLFHHNRAELDAAQEASGELLRLAERPQATAALASAHRASGTVALFRGEFDRALADFALALVHYDPAIHAIPTFIGDNNVRLSVPSFTAWMRLFQGRFGEALARSREALDTARDLANPYTSAFSLHVNCLFNQVSRDWRTVQERSALLVSLAAEHGFPHLLATGTFFEGWAAFASGETEAGVTRMHQGLAAKRAGGAEIKVPYYLGVLADAYMQTGRAAEALLLLTDALARVERTGERWFEAELHRLMAEMLIALGPTQDAIIDAEARLRQALAVARMQGARLWELRASVSLARLLRDQGRRREARDLLAPIYTWFAEEFDMLDVKVAKALLEELAGHPHERRPRTA